jgi:hypothetical protein
MRGSTGGASSSYKAVSTQCTRKMTLPAECIHTHKISLYLTFDFGFMPELSSCGSYTHFSPFGLLGSRICARSGWDIASEIGVSSDSTCFGDEDSMRSNEDGLLTRVFERRGLATCPIGDESSFVKGVRVLGLETPEAPEFWAVVLKTDETVLVWELAERTQFNKSPCNSLSSPASIAVSRPSSLLLLATTDMLAAARPGSSRDLDVLLTSRSVLTGSSNGESSGFDFARSRSLARFFAALGAAGKKSEKPAAEARDMVLTGRSTLTSTDHRPYDMGEAISLICESQRLGMRQERTRRTGKRSKPDARRQQRMMP